MDRIAFVLSEALAGIRRNVGMSLAAVTTAALALFLLGGMFLVARGLNQAAANLTGKFEMRTYLVQGATQADIGTTAKAIRAIPGVATAQWIPKDKAWDRQKVEMGKELTEGIPNPLPDGFKVTLSDLKAADSVAAAIGALPKIDRHKGVDYLKAEQKFVQGSRSLLNWLSSVLGAIFLGVSGVLVFNTTRLALNARRAEVRVMRLVGAHWFVVDAPFLIEGIVHGTMAGVLATGALSVVYGLVTKQAAGLIAGTQAPAFEYVAALQALSLSGAVFGLVCAALAVWIPERRRQG